MANVKISQLPSGSIPTDNDYLPIVDFETLTTTAVRAAYLAAYVSSSIQQLNLNSLTASNVTAQSLSSSFFRNSGATLLLGSLSGTTAVFQQLTGAYGQFVQITGSSIFLDPTIPDTSGNPIRLKIRSRSNTNVQMINLGDINDSAQLWLGTDGVSSFGTMFTNKGMRISAGSTGLGFGDLSIGTSSAAGVFSERLGFRDAVGIVNEATFNNPKNNFNFRVSAATNQNMIVVSASQNMIGIGIQPQESVHISGTAIRFDGPIYGYSSAYNNLTGNYVLTNADNGKVISINAAAQATVTLPLNLTGGFGVSLFQTGIGALFVTGVIGVTTFNRQNQYRTAGQYAVASLIYVSGNAYIFGGDTQL